MPDSPAYVIEAVPSLRVAVPGSKVTYHLRRSDPAAADPQGVGCQWFEINDPSSVTLTRPATSLGPSGPVWENAEWSFEGHHRVVCRVRANGQTTDFVFEQNVAALRNVIAVGPTLPFVKNDPDAVLTAVSQKLDVVVAWGNAQPPSTDALRQKHRDQVAALTDYRDRLRDRLKASDGLSRFPIDAEYLSTENPTPVPLNVFVYEKSDGTLAVVDWTNVTVQRMTGEYAGSGATPREAVKAALDQWDSDNRYPDGGITFRLEQVPGVSTIQSSFTTDGSAFWDSVSHFFGYVGLGAAIVAAAATAVAPVPGSQVVSALLWTAIFSGTVSATLNIGQRHVEGFADFRADAFDVLSIVANCFAGTAIWARGATIATPLIARAALFGAVGADGVQGVMIAEESVREIERIRDDPNLTPSEKTDQICTVLRGLAIAGTLIYVNVKGTKADLENLSTQSKHFPDTPTPQQKLDALKDPATVPESSGAPNLTEPPALPEGHTADGTHTTKVQIDQEEQTPQASGRSNDAHLRSPEQRLRDAMGNAHYERHLAEVSNLRAAHPEVASLSDDEVICLRAYLEDVPKPEFAGLRDFQRINRALVSGDQAQLTALREYIDTLTRTVKKMPPYEGRVSRKVPADVADEEVQRQFKQGGEWSNANFLSTSAGNALDHARALITIVRTRSGHQVSSLQLFSEREVLFVPGVRFRVLKVIDLGPGSPTRFIITMEEL
ncbi:MAG: hypothetical protein ACRENE_23475 [Polyangiaceae bacterium]